MRFTARKSARKGRGKKSLLQVVRKHPVRTAGITAGALVGIALLRKAANTAARVVTIKAVAGAATDIAGAVGSRGGRKIARRRGAKARFASKA